jgi:hypothetical protein
MTGCEDREIEVGGSADAGGFAGFGFAVGYRGLVEAEACGGGGKCEPIGVFVGEEEVVDVAVRIGCAAEGGADFGGDGKRGEDLLHGSVEDCVGNREQAHEEEVGTLHGDRRQRDGRRRNCGSDGWR